MANSKKLIEGRQTASGWRKITPYEMAKMSVTYLIREKLTSNVTGTPWPLEGRPTPFDQQDLRTTHHSCQRSNGLTGFRRFTTTDGKTATSYKAAVTLASFLFRGKFRATAALPTEHIGSRAPLQHGGFADMPRRCIRR
nr:hypothetical protein [Streptomyces chartreusis]